MNRQKSPFKLKYFLAELLILIIGISASFLLNEYRVSQQESRQEVELLANFKKNLMNDSIVLSSGVEQLTKQLEAAGKVLQYGTLDYSDSLVLNVLSLLSYVPFNSNDITYQEMKNLGNSRIIKSDDLLTAIIGLYENGYGLVGNWADVDGEHVRDRLIPFVEQNFPFVPNLNYPLADTKTKRDLMTSINSDEFKHLVQFGASYKASAKYVYSEVLKDIKEVIVLIDSSLVND